MSDEDYSIRSYLAEISTAITLLESKVLRSVWLVVSKPGYLSTQYLRRRVRYMKPLQLFIFLNVVYYFSLTLFSATTFATPLATQLHMNNYYPSSPISRSTRNCRRSRSATKLFEQKYNKKTSVLSRTLIFALIPIFALVFYVLFFRKRRYIVEHAVIATHFWSFSLILLGVILPLSSVLLIRLSKALNSSVAYVGNDAVTSSALQLCMAAYLFIMRRRAYAASRWYCAVTALAIAWSFFHIVWLYRLLLFNVTLGVV